MNAKHTSENAEGNPSIRNWIIANDNENGDEVRKYDAMMAKKRRLREEKKARELELQNDTGISEQLNEVKLTG